MAWTLKYLKLRTFIFVYTLWNTHLVNGASDGLARCPQNLPYTSKWATFRDKCYQFVNVERFWDEARDHCWANQGSLVSIPDRATNQFIVNTLNSMTWNNNGVWIGLHDRKTELIWEWVTPERGGKLPLTFTNWDSDHPGAWFHSRRDCVHMSRDGGQWKWHETACHSLKWHYRFICQYEMTRTTTAEPGYADGHMRGQPRTTTEGVKSGHHLNNFGGLPDTDNMRKSSTDAPSEQTKYTDGSQLKKLKPDDTSAHNALGHMEMVSNEKETNNNLIFVVVAICIGVVVLVIVLAMLIVRRRRRKDQQELIVAGIPPKYDNPLYGDGELGVAQALLNGNHQRNGTGCPPQQAAEACGNVYVTPEEMQGTGVTHKFIKFPPVQQPQQESAYLAPVEARREQRPLPACPQDDDPEEEPEELLKKAGVGGYMPVPSTESLDIGMPGYLPMDGASRRGSRDTLEINLDDEESSSAPLKDSGEKMAGFAYDSPKPSHIYAEIPCSEPEANIYEALDDIKH